HTILGDQRIRPAAGDLEPQRLQIDRGRGMEDGKHERAAVEDHLLAAETGADIGFIARRAAVKFGKQEADNKNNENANSDGYCKFPHIYALRDVCCCVMRSAGAEMAMKHLASRSTSRTLAPTGSGVDLGLARAATLCQLPKTSLR